MSAVAGGVTASTGIVAVLGSPIRHSLSPLIHNAAFAEVGLDLVMVACEVGEGDAAGAVAAMRSLGVRGASVTMPLKAAVVDHLDELTPVAETLGAVNCIAERDGRLIGDNTDGEGFIAGLRTDFDLEVGGLPCVVLGAGGAARAVTLALAAAGASSVTVMSRSAGPAAEAAALAGPIGSVAPLRDLDAVAAARLVVNATPVGMYDDAVPLDPAALGDGQVVAELIYHPARTALMSEARQRGCRSSNGVSMLVHQAAAAFERWTGTPAPVAEMSAVARRSLGGGPRP